MKNNLVLILLTFFYSCKVKNLINKDSPIYGNYKSNKYSCNLKIYKDKSYVYERQNGFCINSFSSGIWVRDKNILVLTDSLIFSKIKMTVLKTTSFDDSIELIIRNITSDLGSYSVIEYWDEGQKFIKENYGVNKFNSMDSMRLIYQSWGYPKILVYSDTYIIREKGSYIVNIFNTVNNNRNIEIDTLRIKMHFFGHPTLYHFDTKLKFVGE